MSTTQQTSFVAKPPPVLSLGQYQELPHLQEPHLHQMSDSDDDENIPVSHATQQILPPSHHLATTLGLSNDRLQVMKASFFAEEDRGLSDHAHLLDMGRPPPTKLITTPQSRLVPPVLPGTRVTSNLFPHPPVETLGTLESVSPSDKIDSSLQMLHFQSPFPSFRPQAPPTPSIQCHKVDHLVPMDDSILKCSTGFHGDAAMAFGRSFRVGWGPNWTLCHSGLQLSSSLGDTAAAASGRLLSTAGNVPVDNSYKFCVNVEELDASPWMKTKSHDYIKVVPLISIYLSFVHLFRNYMNHC